MLVGHVFLLNGLSVSDIFIISVYSVMQSNRKSSTTDTFHEPITYEPHVYTNLEEIITFARHEY